jgi:CheY-like chemotaxis protein
MSNEHRVSGARKKVLDVLVVEDDADTREMTRDLLTDEGCFVRCCGSGAEARVAAMESVPHVVITDLALEEKASGFALARELRAHPRTERVALVLLSGHEPGPEVRRAFDVCLRKPVGLDDIVEAVRSLGDRAGERSNAGDGRAG